MAPSPLRVGIDMSVLAVNPLTGVGVHSLNLFEAFLRTQPDFEVRLFASSARPVFEHLKQLTPLCADSKITRWPTRLKVWLWTRAEWPPIEWFTGPADIVYGGFHLEGRENIAVGFNSNFKDSSTEDRRGTDAGSMEDSSR